MSTFIFNLVRKYICVYIIKFQMLKTAWISKLCCFRIIAFLWCCYSVIGIFSVIYSKWSRLRLIILWVSTLSIYSKVTLLTHRMDVFYALSNAVTLKWSTWILIERKYSCLNLFIDFIMFYKNLLEQIALLNIPIQCRPQELCLWCLSTD